MNFPTTRQFQQAQGALVLLTTLVPEQPAPAGPRLSDHDPNCPNCAPLCVHDFGFSAATTAVPLYACEGATTFDVAGKRYRVAVAPTQGLKNLCKHL